MFLRLFKNGLIFGLTFLSYLGFAQDFSEFIVVDQFGYPPVSKKFAMIRDPQAGFDAGESFEPGNEYALVNLDTDATVFASTVEKWNFGQTDDSSGDIVWKFDFSAVTETGSYYVLDVANNVRSYEFDISPSVYNEVLKHAVRTFFYQRVGYEKQAQYAGEAWADGASHMRANQDPAARLFSNSNSASTERDLTGGWYDAGDFNKYTNWTANYVTEMMKAYLEAPNAWGDDYNIPESGNGVPDLLDEAKWGVDHLVRMQSEDGSVLSIVSESGASPPSNAAGASLYGPANTSATLNTAAALAISSKVYRMIGEDSYADDLQSKAEAAWDWAVQNPNVLFRNNDPDYNSEGLGAGQQEESDYQRAMTKLEASCFLFEVTGDAEYKSFFDANYEEAHMLDWNYVYPYEGYNQDMLIYYASLAGATPSVAADILAVYTSSMNSSEDNFPAQINETDPYRAHLGSYTWGSNSIKSIQGTMFYNLITYDIDPTVSENAQDAALSYINYIHGVNPLNMTFLTNMYNYGGDNCANEFYHTWFTDGSAKWDRVGESQYGPAPGFLTGGANPSYSVDGCCPSNCGSGNNDKCTSENLTPPLGQPHQKSYKDFNTSWPLNSWSVTENSCGYQINYIRLLSKFVNLNYDCNGDDGGTAEIDACGNCTGGSTGVDPVTDPSECGDVEPPLKVGSSLDLNIDVYPNPNHGSFEIRGLHMDHFDLTIIDMTGKTVFSGRFEIKDTIDATRILPGSYLLKIEHEDGTVIRKIVRS